MREVHRKGRKVGKEEGKKRGGKTQRFWDWSKIVSIKDRPRLLEAQAQVFHTQ